MSLTSDEGPIGDGTQRVEGGRTSWARHKMYSAWLQLCVNLDTHFGLEADNDLPLRVLGHYCLGSQVSSSSTRPAHPELPFHMTKSLGAAGMVTSTFWRFFLHGVQPVGKSLMGSRLRTLDRHRAISDRTRRASKSRSTSRGMTCFDGFSATLWWHQSVPCRREG